MPLSTRPGRVPREPVAHGVSAPKRLQRPKSPTLPSRQKHDEIRRPPRSPERLPPARLPDRHGRSRLPPRPREDARDRPARRCAPATAQTAVLVARRRRADPGLRRARRRDAAGRPLSTPTPDRLVIRGVPAAALHARDRHRDRSRREHQADGALPVERQLVHPVRGGRLPPHHLLPRPAGRALGLHDAHRGAEVGSAGPALQRQPGRPGRPARRPPLRRLARPVPEALLPVRLVAGDLGVVEDSFITASGRERRAPHLLRARQGGRAAPTRWTRSSARCAGTRRPSAANTISTSS